MFEYLFWLSASLVVYGTIGYPALIWLLGRVAPKPVRKRDILPTVTCVIAARNEERTIGAKINNLLSLDYPSDRLDIIIVSDGSTDQTCVVVEQWIDKSNSDAPSFAKPSHVPPLVKGGAGGFESVHDAGVTQDYDHSGRIKLLNIPTNRGKAYALNIGVAAAQGEIILFADARQRFDAQAVRLLVRNFADAEVGAVSGELVLREETIGEGANAGGGLFWRFEKWVRNSESRSGSTIGCTGAIYAARRILIAPLPEGILLDDVLTPIRILLEGYRVVFEEHALAFDRLPDSRSLEFGRKARVRAGNIQLLALIPALLNPLRGSVAWRFMSHKLLPRVLMPYWLLALLVSNLFLKGPLYKSILVAQGVVYAAGICGLLLGTRGGRLFRPAATFLMLNAASVVGSVRYICGSDRDLWSGQSLEQMPRSRIVE